MTDLNPIISIITLNINTLNTPMKSQKLSNCIKSKTQLHTDGKKQTWNTKIQID